MKESNIASLTINCVRWIQNFLKRTEKDAMLLWGSLGEKTPV